MKIRQPGSLQRCQKAWGSRGFTANTQVDPPGKTWPMHQHPVDEIVELNQGVINMKIGAKKQRLKAGAEVIVPRRTPHNIRNPGRTRARYFYGFRNKK